MGVMTAPAMNYYPHHIGDYIRDAGHLSLLEDGIYRRLLDWYYADEMPLPSDPQVIHKRIGARSKSEKNATLRILKEFFTDLPAGWHHKRCDEEILKYKEKSQKASHAAGMRWHNGRNANALQTHCEGNANQNQEPINTKAGDPRPQGETPWWSTQEATLEEAKRLGLSTRGESWDSLKRQIRDKHSSMRRVA